MEEVSIIGIDLAKRSFQVHGAKADGSVASGPRSIGTRVCGLSRPGGRRRTGSTGCRCVAGPWSPALGPQHPRHHSVPVASEPASHLQVVSRYLCKRG